MPIVETDKRHELSGLILIVIALLLGLALYLPASATGVLGRLLVGSGMSLFGVMVYLLPPFFLYMALEYLLAGGDRRSRSRRVQVIITLLLAAAFLHACTLGLETFKEAWALDAGGKPTEATKAISFLLRLSRDRRITTMTAGTIPGGLVGGLIALALQRVAGPVGAIVILAAALLAEMILIFNLSLSRFLDRTRSAVKQTGRRLGQAVNEGSRRARAARGLIRDAGSDAGDWPEEAAAEPRLAGADDGTAVLAPTIDDTRPAGPGPDVSSWLDPERRAALDAAANIEQPVGDDSGFHSVGPEKGGKVHASQAERRFYDPAPPAAPGEGERLFSDIPIFSYDPNPESRLETIDQTARGREAAAAAAMSIPDFLRTEEPPPQPADRVRPPAVPIVEPDAPRPAAVTDAGAGGAGAATAAPARAGAELAEREVRPYRLPPIELLRDVDESRNRLSQNRIAGVGRKLEETLASFGVEARVVNITTGPAITRFELAPGLGVKVSRIVNLADDIALSLAATGVRIEAPIPGKSAIGIEIPNKETTAVGLRPLIESLEYRRAESPLAVALGRDIPGAPIMCDLTRMPHLLIAGATGSGKSVCINVILTSILYRSHPDDVKMLLIDPKVVELSIYNGIPHLLAPVVTDAKKASNTLRWAVIEMGRRYELFAAKGVRDMQTYNEQIDPDEEERLPLILIVIDELSDLMALAAHEVEDSIARLTAMARAAGMHLVIATQRPSVDVITGVIKANIPSRIAFMVSSQVDSRTILDMGGAEKLLGRGDMLYAPQSVGKPIRGQGAYITEAEIERVVAWCKEQNVDGYDEELSAEITAPKDDAADSGVVEDQDELFEDAVDIVLDVGHASVSILQRRLNVGYPRAGKLIDQMEQAGYIGPFEGSKPRKLLLQRSEWEERRERARSGEGGRP
ncbi:MAG: DNA translocase FtsK 4TM domain-containing protein [Bacillota bacterium]|nr:DNA translocase FtsK 4TM domain-containing protein [Bacillota bacterium]